MKKILLLGVLVVSFFSCEKKTAEQESDDMLPESNAKLNNVSVIIDNQLWRGVTGDSLRAKLSQPVEGLPQDEQMFDINQYPVQVFKGFATKSRNIIIVENGKPKNFTILKNEFAKPQTVIHISGANVSELVELIQQKQAIIIQAFQKSEITENQRRMRKALLNDDRIKKEFGISLQMPQSYRYDMERKKFFWLRKQFKMGMSAYSPSGYNSIVIYELPLSTIKPTDDILTKVISVRDSVSKINIQGMSENSWMTTEQLYLPYFYKTTLAGKPTYLTKGVWEVKNDFMSGPFINYIVRDEKNNRYIVIEGFAYFPSQSKRELVLELESIIQSVKFL